MGLPYECVGSAQNGTVKSMLGMGLRRRRTYSMMANTVQASGDPTVSAGAWGTLQKCALYWSRRQVPQKGAVTKYLKP